MKAALQKLKPFLEKAVQSYQNFAGVNCPMDAKEFNSYHSACKAALLHIALLNKILGSAEVVTDTEPNLIDLIHQAKEDLQDENDIS